LANILQGNASQNSDYWNGWFQRSGFGVQLPSKTGLSQPPFTGLGDEPADVGRPDPWLSKLAGQIREIHKVTCLVYSESAPRDRAEDLSISGSGEPHFQARASTLAGARRGI